MSPPRPVTPNGHHGMGWRKPVPTFIPSPPITAAAFDVPAPREPVAQDDMPPLPEDWRNVVLDAFQRVRSTEHVDGPEPMRELAPSPTMVRFQAKADTPGPQLEASASRQASSSRSGISRKGSIQQTYRPPTPPLRSSRPRSFAPPLSPSAQSPYRMLYPDPPSVYMKDASQDLHHKASDIASTFPASSVTARPSVQSLTSDNRTVVDSVDTSSWYLPSVWQAEWERVRELDIQREKDLDPNKSQGLPMHVLPASALKKNRKRSCSTLLWHAVASVGRAVSYIFGRSSA